jgi:hypothetical protein
MSGASGKLEGIWLLSDKDVECIVETTLKTVGSAAEDDLQMIVEWANDARVFALLVDMVIKGEVGIAPGDGEPVFVSPEHTKEPLR